MKRTFFISGLGANERAFETLNISKFNGVTIPWLKNIENETLEGYTIRLIQNHKILNDDLIVGLSFGGILAQKIAEILRMNSVVLISSFRTKKDLKSLFRLGLKTKAYKLMPEIKLPLINEIVANFLNSGTEQSKPVLKEMLLETDMKLLKWSIQKISELNKPIAGNINKYNIIGTNDRVINTWENDLTYEITGGSHFMVYDKSTQVSAILDQIIKEESLS